MMPDVTCARVSPCEEREQEKLKSTSSLNLGLEWCHHWGKWWMLFFVKSSDQTILSQQAQELYKLDYYSLSPLIVCILVFEVEPYWVLLHRNYTAHCLLTRTVHIPRSTGAASFSGQKEGIWLRQNQTQYTFPLLNQSENIAIFSYTWPSQLSLFICSILFAHRGFQWHIRFLNWTLLFCTCFFPWTAMANTNWP